MVQQTQNWTSGTKDAKIRYEQKHFKESRTSRDAKIRWEQKHFNPTSNLSSFAGKNPGQAQEQYKSGLAQVTLNQTLIKIINTNMCTLHCTPKLFIILFLVRILIRQNFLFLPQYGFDSIALWRFPKLNLVCVLKMIFLFWILIAQKIWVEN